MKILFSVGILEKELNASNKIAFNVAQQLKKLGHECFLIGVNSYTKKTETYDKCGVTFVELPKRKRAIDPQYLYKKFCEEKGIAFLSRKSKIKFILKFPIQAFWFKFERSKYYETHIFGKMYAQNVKKLLDKENISKVICFYMPLEFTDYILNYKKIYEKYDTYVYQVDPWGLAEHDFFIEKHKMIEQERMFFEKAKHIFTTPVLLNAYKNEEGYKEFVGKMTELEFPDIKDISVYKEIQSPIKFDKTNKNILFCGTLEDSFRSPEYFFKMIEKLIVKHKNIKLHFLSKPTSAFLKEYVKKYPDNFFVYETVTLEKAFSAMYSADILLNIDNSYRYQVPSKIFDYFSTGKPVISVVKIKEDPSLPYLKKYPNGFIVNELEEIDEQLKRLEDFIVENKNDIPFLEMERIFEENTPQYVSAKVYKNL